MSTIVEKNKKVEYATPEQIKRHEEFMEIAARLMMMANNTKKNAHIRNNNQS